MMETVWKKMQLRCLIDLQTGVQLPSTLEVHDQLEEEKVHSAVQQAQLDEQQVLLDRKNAEFLVMVATMARLRYSNSVADELMVMMRQTAAPVPEVDTVQAWMAAPAAEQCLELARRYFERRGNNG